ncbi:MAG: hypothetical protein ACR2OT_04055 [Parvibaculales bacterium]
MEPLWILPIILLGICFIIGIPFGLITFIGLMLSMIFFGFPITVLVWAFSDMTFGGIIKWIIRFSFYTGLVITPIVGFVIVVAFVSTWIGEQFKKVDRFIENRHDKKDS